METMVKRIYASRMKDANLKEVRITQNGGRYILVY